MKFAKDLLKDFVYRINVSYFKINRDVMKSKGVASDYLPQLGIGYINNQQDLIYDYEEFSISLMSYFDKDIIPNVNQFY